MKYIDIKKLANDFSNKLDLFKELDLIDIMKRLKIDINKKTILEIEKTYFLKINEDKTYSLNIPISNDNNLDRFFYAQALGHIILHINSKNNIIESITKFKGTQQAIWFALELLMPDDILTKDMLSKNNLVLSNLFRVTEEIVEMKRAIINKKELNLI